MFGAGEANNNHNYHNIKNDITLTSTAIPRKKTMMNGKNTTTNRQMSLNSVIEMS